MSTSRSKRRSRRSKKITKQQLIMIIIASALAVITLVLGALLALDTYGYFDEEVETEYDIILPPKLAYGDPMTENGYSFAKLTDGTVMIIAFTGQEEEIMNVPSTLGGYKVSAIGEVAFASTNEIIKEIHLPEGITYIGKGAFSGIENAKLYLPLSIEQIDNQALYGFEDPLGIYYNGGSVDWIDVKIGSDNKVLANVIFLK